MCFLPKAAVTKYHWWSDLDNRHLFYLSSGGQKSKIKMSTGVCSLWGLQREDPSLPLLVLSSGWPTFVLLDLQLQHSNLCLCHHVASAHYVNSCVSSFNKDTNHVGLGPTLLQHDRILINCIFNNPISKKVTFQGPRDQDFKVTFGEGHSDEKRPRRPQFRRWRAHHLGTDRLGFWEVTSSPSAVESPQSVPKCRDTSQERRGHGLCPGMKAGCLTRWQGTKLGLWS